MQLLLQQVRNTAWVPLTNIFAHIRYLSCLIQSFSLLQQCNSGIQFLSHCFLLPYLFSLQLFSGAGSLHLTQVSVPTPSQVGLEDQGQVTLGQTTSTGSLCQSSSPNSSGLSHTPAAVTVPHTARHRCRHLRVEPPSWASTASVSWLPGSSSVPLSGPETSHTSQSCQSQSRSVFMYFTPAVKAK